MTLDVDRIQDIIPKLVAQGVPWLEYINYIHSLKVQNEFSYFISFDIEANWMESSIYLYECNERDENLT